MIMQKKKKRKRIQMQMQQNCVQNLRLKNQFVFPSKNSSNCILSQYSSLKLLYGQKQWNQWKKIFFWNSEKRTQMTKQLCNNTLLVRRLILSGRCCNLNFRLIVRLVHFHRGDSFSSMRLRPHQQFLLRTTTAFRCSFVFSWWCVGVR